MSQGEAVGGGGGGGGGGVVVVVVVVAGVGCSLAGLNSTSSQNLTGCVKLAVSIGGCHTFT